MNNPRLTTEELKKAKKLLVSVKKKILELSRGNKGKLFAYRRKVFIGLIYDERGTPAERTKLKKLLFKKQKGKCKSCRDLMAMKGSILDRKYAPDGYTEKNVNLICQLCDRDIQLKRKYT